MSQVGPAASYHSKTPPLKGAFPLDHDGECKELVKDYLRCLKSNGAMQAPCRGVAKEYFECRMKNGLMAPDDWKSLGLGDLEQEQSGQVSEL